MSQTERFYRLRHLLDSGRCVSKACLLHEFGISQATLKRDLAHLRDRMNTPVVWDREARGYRIAREQPVIGMQYELPGLWLSAEEIHALLTMQHLLAHLDAGGLLAPHIAPMMKRLTQVLGEGTEQAADLGRRIRVQTVGARRLHLPHFQAVGSALLRRRRLVIEYHGRGSNQHSDREVSPQRLIHYRDNWYLDHAEPRAHPGLRRHRGRRGRVGRGDPPVGRGGQPCAQPPGDLWFAYDAMNRQVLADGAVDSNAANAAHLTASQGHVLGYNADGNRMTRPASPSTAPPTPSSNSTRTTPSCWTSAGTTPAAACCAAARPARYVSALVGTGPTPTMTSAPPPATTTPSAGCSASTWSTRPTPA